MGRVVVADAGPLIAFGRIGRLSLLPKVLGTVLVPEAVIGECLADARPPGAQAIGAALASQLLTRIGDPAPIRPRFATLGAGESVAIQLALELSVAILIDEKTGRRIAANLGLTSIGTVGVLIAAKERRYVDAVRPLLDALNAEGYHLSDALIRAALTRARED